MTTNKPKKIDGDIISLAKGGGILTVGKIVAYANRFVIAFLLARLLGPDDYGLYSLALTISAIVSTISLFGLDDAIMRYVAIYHGQGDDARLWGVIQFCLGVVLVLSVVLGVGLYFTAEAISIRIFNAPDLVPLIELVSFIIPFLSLSEMLMYASQGFKKMHYSVIAEQFIQLPLRVVVILILMFLRLDAFLALLTFGVTDLIASVFLFFFINKEFSLLRSLKDARWEVGEISKFAFPFWISDLLNTMRNHVQTLFLGSLSTITSVGIFTIIDRVNLVSKMAYRSISTSTKPVIAELQAKEDWAQVGYLYKVSSRWGITLNLPVFLILVIFPNDLLSLFGASYQAGATALIFLAFSELVNTGTGLGGVIIDMTGQNRIKLFNSIFQVILSISANVILIRAYGLLGAAIASLISIGTINILRMAEVFWLYGLVPYDASYFKPLSATGGGLLFGFMIAYLVPSELSVLRLIAGSFIIALTFVGILIMLGLPDEEQEIMNRARSQFLVFRKKIQNRAK
jgi:O-antigen/teichoic acid export membrane protein